MLALTWTLFAALAVILTGAAWITAAATQWIAQALASGTAAQATRDLAALPLPAWLESWVDPAWLQPLHAGLQWAIESTAAVLPLAGTAAGWLVPAVWVVWALGMVLLLVGAIAAHALLRRFAGQAPRRTALPGAA